MEFLLKFTLFNDKSWEFHHTGIVACNNTARNRFFLKDIYQGHMQVTSTAHYVQHAGPINKMVAFQVFVGKNGVNY